MHNTRDIDICSSPSVGYIHKEIRQSFTLLLSRKNDAIQLTSHLVQPSLLSLKVSPIYTNI